MKTITSNFFEANLFCDEVKKSKGVFTCRKGFFYTHGNTTEKFKDSIEKQLNNLNINFEIIDSGEIWKPFKGGASLRSQSHWFVKFIVT